MSTQPAGTPEELAEAADKLARIFARTIRVLGDSGHPQEANILGGQAWSAIRRVHPHGAQRINGTMHYLAKLEGEGGVGTADASDVPVTRVTKVVAREGGEADLLRAARKNTEDALAAGAISAEVCRDPGVQGGIAVISRWARTSELEEFLDWHEPQARGSMADFAEGGPAATHYLLVRG